MSMGRRKSERQEGWIASTDLPAAPNNVFYEKLNRLLAEQGFDSFVEDLCGPHYAENKGRDSIPPGVYFRMLLIGYFEGLDSQRGIAWRCADSLSLKSFLGYSLAEATPDHSSLTRVGQRLPIEVHEQVFPFVLKIARVKKLLKGKTVAVDATLLEANAAMKSIVRRDTGDGWKAYLIKLMAELGIENPTDEDIRRFDKKRKGKKVSNKDWVSSSDPESRITRMKDGRTHLAHKAEHVVDLDTDLLLAATIHAGDRSDSESGIDSVIAAQTNLISCGSDAEIKEIVNDKGYHEARSLAQYAAWGLRTYTPEPKRNYHRTWVDKPDGYQSAVYANRRRVKGRRGKRLSRLRSEYVERSFAHMCETGAARRSWLRGLERVSKRYTIHAAARNLGVIMRKLFGIGTPRSLQGAAGSALAYLRALRPSKPSVRGVWRVLAGWAVTEPAPLWSAFLRPPNAARVSRAA